MPIVALVLTTQFIVNSLSMKALLKNHKVTVVDCIQ
uniref:Uncharacterized protein n=1 Tax=Arundo donax TaxID=35708 RepID=A0A0A9A0W3_ARUDO